MYYFFNQWVANLIWLLPFPVQSLTVFRQNPDQQGKAEKAIFFRHLKPDPSVYLVPSVPK